MGKKKHVKILSSDVELEIREIVRDELKKTTKSDMKKLLEEINKIIANKVTDHLLSLSAFLTDKLGKKE